MKQRKPNAGRHVAIERGLHPNGAGWPFRRELRQLSVLVRAAQTEQSRVRVEGVASSRPHQA
jgi:hypothetical protein